MQGVYKITNITNGMVYIGSSKDIEKRWQEHLDALATGTHHSYKLQEDYDALENKNNLKFEVLVIVKNEEDLSGLEQYYYDKYKSYKNGYNCCKFVNNPKYVDVKKNKSKELDSLAEQITKRMMADEKMTKSGHNKRLTSRTYYEGKLSAFSIVLKLIDEINLTPQND